MTRGLQAHVVAYEVVNASLIALWALVWIGDGTWFPWPLLIMVAWGVVLALHVRSTVGRRRHVPHRRPGVPGAERPDRGRPIPTGGPMPGYDEQPPLPG
ncbi:MAG TPA: 2TM domain-containing protein [Acidimicrobiales bacterium]|nr:2TM domain-containing protein [Acidimicrobiales bacterium]